jgi:hypothetical protein
VGRMAQIKKREGLSADDRGRVYLGSEFADETVDVVVISDDASDDERDAN